MRGGFSAIVRAMSYGPGDAVDLVQVRRVLVVKLRHHGDVLLASPVITALKRHAPHAEVDALVYADTAEMLLLHPGLAQLHRVERNWKSLGMPARASATPSSNCRAMTHICANMKRLKAESGSRSTADRPSRNPSSARPSDTSM